MAVTYTALIISRLSEASDAYPELSFSEILYSILRKKNLSSRTFDGSETTKFLLETDDKDIYKSIDKFIKDA